MVAAHCLLFSSAVSPGQSSLRVTYPLHTAWILAAASELLRTHWRTHHPRHAAWTRVAAWEKWAEGVGEVVEVLEVVEVVEVVGVVGWALLCGRGEGERRRGVIGWSRRNVGALNYDMLSNFSYHKFWRINIDSNTGIQAVPAVVPRIQLQPATYTMDETETLTSFLAAHSNGSLPTLLNDVNTTSVTT